MKMSLLSLIKEQSAWSPLIWLIYGAAHWSVHAARSYFVKQKADTARQEPGAAVFSEF